MTIYSTLIDTLKVPSQKIALFKDFLDKAEAAEISLSQQVGLALYQIFQQEKNEDYQNSNIELLFSAFQACKDSNFWEKCFNLYAGNSEPQADELKLITIARKFKDMPAEHLMRE